MEKRFQVFISSTFKDLIEERQAVLKAVLEIDHMPAGMELFPAGDEAAWELIKEIIDASDYYILIVGGRYGSLGEEGLSFTEKEYDHAVSQKKPVIPLLHKSPDNLPRGKTDTDPDSWKMLQKFRKKIESNHTCVYWNSTDELKAMVIVGLTAAIKKKPGIGWVRADQVPTRASIEDLLKAQQKIAQLENELREIQSGPPPGTENLLQGDDEFEIKIRFEARKSGDFMGTAYTATITPTWNEIFSSISPILMNEASEMHVSGAFSDFISSYSKEAFSDDEDLKGLSLVKIIAEQSYFHTCLVQFRALGLLTESEKKRSVRDTGTYWQLTQHGDHLMVQLRALHKNIVEKKATGSKSEGDDSGT
jgi:hypothetical protein